MIRSLIIRSIVLVILIVLVCDATFVISSSPYLVTTSGVLTGLLGLILQFTQVQDLLSNLLRDIAEHIFQPVGHYIVELTKKKWFWIATSCLLALALILSIVTPHLTLPISQHLTPTPTPDPVCQPPSGALASSGYINTERTPDGQYIGISDGNDVFDTQLADAKTKQEASLAFRSKDYGPALSKWNDARGAVSNDAEAAIYGEDLHVTNTGQSYVDVVLSMTFIPSQIGAARDALRGAYIAQLEFNQTHTLQVRLDIANSGNGHAKEVTCQIIHAASIDSHLVGIMGWTISKDTLASVPLVDDAHLPMLAAASSSTDLSGYPYFARVNPPDQAQADDEAEYAKQQLHATKVAIFYDPSNTYSASVKSEFQRQFQVGGHIVAQETYTIGQPQTLPGLVHDALQQHPDLIYFAGYASEVGALLGALPPCQAEATDCLPVLGSSALARYGDFTPAAQADIRSGRLYFTAFAFADEWGTDEKDRPQQVNDFLRDYKDQFGPTPPNTGPYGFTRPEADSMLAFDAITVLATSCSTLSKKGSVTPEGLRQTLMDINGDKAFQGITGQISFGPNGNPQNKKILLLHIGSDGLTKIEQTWGCLRKDQCE